MANQVQVLESSLPLIQNSKTRPHIVRPLTLAPPTCSLVTHPEQGEQAVSPVKATGSGVGSLSGHEPPPTTAPGPRETPLVGSYPHVGMNLQKLYPKDTSLHHMQGLLFSMLARSRVVGFCFLVGSYAGSNH